LTYVIGHFNAKVGQKEHDERAVGNFGLGERNNRGQRLVDFASRHKMRITNTFYKKPVGRKWTWQGPNATVKNEIDYILATRPDTVKDISVISRVNTGSDHRPVIAKVKINTRCERARKIKS
jgi:endonuclease/exonuclease/phosphatase family metal-dependent hydrolase